MKQKSRIKDLAESELSELRVKLKDLPRGGITTLSKSTGIHKASIYRFMDGKVIGCDKSKIIEVALRNEAA